MCADWPACRQPFKKDSKSQATSRCSGRWSVRAAHTVLECALECALENTLELALGNTLELGTKEPRGTLVAMHAWCWAHPVEHGPLL